MCPWPPGERATPGQVRNPSQARATAARRARTWGIRRRRRLRLGTPDEGDGTSHVPPATPPPASGDRPAEQVTAASGRRARMTSAEVGFTSMDEIPPKRRTAVSLVLAEPERRRRRTAVLPEVRHLTRTERVAIGKGARGHIPRSCHAELYLGADRPDPIALLEESGPHAGPGAGADPLRPDARVPVRVLPRRGPGHGVGSEPHAGHGDPRAAVRRRAPVELRALRVA